MLKQIKSDGNGGLTLGRRGLRCGDVLQVLVPTLSEGAELVTVRLEKSDDWYFAGLTEADVLGCFARFSE